MLPVYADENVVGPLVSALRQRGLDVVTAIERSLGSADDELILAEALHLGRLLLTNDQDFLRLASQAHVRGEEFAPILFWPQQQRPLAQLITRIVQVAMESDYAALCSRVFFL